MRTAGRVAFAFGVPTERLRTAGRVGGADRIAKERAITSGRAKVSGGEAKKGVLPLRRVASGIASIRRRDNRLRHRCKPKAGKQERDEEEAPS